VPGQASVASETPSRIVDIQMQMAGLPLSAGERVKSAEFGPRQPVTALKMYIRL
jgi:hypothetical protein